MLHCWNVVIYCFSFDNLLNTKCNYINTKRIDINIFINELSKTIHLIHQ